MNTPKGTMHFLESKGKSEIQTSSSHSGAPTLSTPKSQEVQSLVDLKRQGMGREKLFFIIFLAMENCHL